MKKLLSIIFCFAALLCNAQGVTRFVVDEAKECQPIDGFGASDCWTMQWVGLWPDSVRQQIADWLFSQETDADGQPKGIGLSIWRFNIGAGSQDQGEASQINGLWNRQETFLKDVTQKVGTDADKTKLEYDFDKLKGQRWMLREAKRQGVPYALGFLNSPPVIMTQNGRATNTGRDSTLNLRTDCYNLFARYLADVVEGVRDTDGITFDYLCPVNEPDGHWNWFGPKQEGTPALNEEVAKVVRLTGQEFARRGLPTLVVANESSDYRCMFATHEAGPKRGYEIQQFFTPDSTDTYIGDVPNLAPFMAGHSYWTNTPLTDLRGIREQLRDTIASRGIRFWQTETCIMGNDDELNGGWRFDRSMKTALYVARIIHHDLVYADASSWSWWRAAGGNYKDGLIYIHEDKDLLSGQAFDSKLMWALGNYSRFVRPGAVRLQVDGRRMFNATDPVGLMCSAYRNADGKRVAVIINYADEDRDFNIDFTDAIEMTPYLTSKGDYNLTPQPTISTADQLQIPARSIVTLYEN